MKITNRIFDKGQPWWTWPPPQTTKRPVTPNCCYLHDYKQKSKPSSQLLTNALRQLPCSLERTQTKLGDHKYPHTRLTQKKNILQPLSRSIFPEPVLCMEVSPVISGWYRSTSGINSPEKSNSANLELVCDTRNWQM